MQHLCFLFLLALGVSVFADSPTGFAEIPFGASLKDAQAAMSNREGVNAEGATAERLQFKGGTFAGQPVSKWTLNFAAGKFAAGTALIDDVKKPVYDELKAQLTKKYGKPDSEKGHHSWECLWEFRSDGRRSVRLNFDFAGKVEITYSHGTLAKAALPAKKSDL